MDITHGIQMIFRLTSTLEKKEGKDSVSSLSLLSLKHPLILRKSELERLVFRFRTARTCCSLVESDNKDN